MADAKKPLRLSPELEKALLAGVLYGAVPLDAVKSDELSGPSRMVFKAASDLIVAGQSTPLSLPAVLLALTDVYGVNRDSARAYLEAIKVALPAASGVEAVVRKLREKHALLSVANTAALQLQKGTFDPAGLMEVIAATGTAGPPVALSEVLKDGMPAPPARLPMQLLPRFTERIGGGLVGLTVVAGEPAVGKSTIAWQIALDVGREIPVLYYDLDNGLPTLMERTRQMFGENLENIRSLTKNLYLRDSTRTLDSDTVHVPAPALVVVDIFQALPTPQEYERQGLGQWIHRFAGLRKRGYHVLVVSEVGRASYGTVSLAAAKGSGEIEYTADLVCQMLPNNIGAEVHITKNRHGPNKGLIVTLQRERGFVWREAEGEVWN